eukprot:53017_1
MAHFEVTGYGTLSTKVGDKGFMHIGNTNSLVHHWFMHDISVFNVNRENGANDANSLWEWGNNELQYYMVHNCEFKDYSFAALDTKYNTPSSLPPYNEQSHHIRISNSFFRTFTNDNTKNSVVAIIRGLYNHFEWLNNVFDGNVGVYGPNKIKANGGLTGIAVYECAQNVIFRNNVFYNFFNPITIWGWHGFCNHRSVNNIIVDHNIIYHDIGMDYFDWSRGNGIAIKDDGKGKVSDGTIIENIEITYNIFDAENSNTQIRPNWQIVFESAFGNVDKAGPGIVKIIGNEAKVTSVRSTFAVFKLGTNAPFPQQKYEIYKNKIYGLTGDLCSNCDHHKLYECVNQNCPSELQADYNIYSACGEFEINSQSYKSDLWTTFQPLWNNQDINTKWCHKDECIASNYVSNTQIVQSTNSIGCPTIEKTSLFSYQYPFSTNLRNGLNAKSIDYIINIVNAAQNVNDNNSNNSNNHYILIISILCGVVIALFGIIFGMHFYIKYKKLQQNGNHIHSPIPTIDTNDINETGVKNKKRKIKQEPLKVIDAATPADGENGATTPLVINESILLEDIDENNPLSLFGVAVQKAKSYDDRDDLENNNDTPITQSEVFTPITPITPLTMAKRIEMQQLNHLKKVKYHVAIPSNS